MFIDGYRGTIVLEGGAGFSGNFYCNDYGDQAEVSYVLANPQIPGEVYGQGKISSDGYGRSYLRVDQNNGLVFSAVR